MNSQTRTHPLRRNGRHPRRGATMVLVAVLAVVLVAMSAFAVDISRMYVGVNELQTVADASALRGALRLQRVPSADPSDTVIAFAARNPALGGSVALVTTDIKPAIWVDTTDYLDTTSAVTWATANAVQVTARRSAGLLFGKVMRSVAPIPARRSLAWIANLSSSTCIKPWGMPMTSIMLMVGATGGTRPLTQSEVATLAAKTVLERTLILAPPYSGNGQIPPATPDGNWSALRINGNGMSQYQSAVEDDDCANGALNVGPKEKDKPGNNLDTKTTQSIDDSVCQFKNNDDTCYDHATGTVAGVPVLVGFTSTPVSNGTESLSVYMLGKFVLQCYRRESGGSNNCVSTKVTNNVWKSYAEGTMLGYIAPDFAALGGGAKLGNTVSTAQRLILVK